MKTIAVLINRPELDWQKSVCAALARHAADAGMRILFFTTNEIRESRDLYNFYNEIIVSFAPLEKMDAILVAFDTFDIPSFRASLVENLKTRVRCPVISIREYFPDFYSVLNSTNESIAFMVRHLHEVHGAERIFFEAGYEGHYDSMEREKAYRAEMERLALPVRDVSVFHGDMWTRAGEDAYRHFFSDPDFRPDAIMCANDFMARSLCEAILDHGLRIPEDVRVTGVDNAATATDYQPHLTTITDDVELMMRETIALILDLLGGKGRSRSLRVPAKLLFRESCGCSDGMSAAEREEFLKTNRQRHFQLLNHLSEQISLESFFRVDINGCETLEEIRESVIGHLGILGNVRSFYLNLLGICGDDGVVYFGEELPDEAMLILGIRDGEVLPARNTVFPAAELVPETLCPEGPGAFYITMLHDRSRCFGYTVTQMEHMEDGMDRFFHSWNQTVGYAIGNLFARREIDLLLRKNRHDSVTDYMTRLHNRRGLEAAMRRIFERGGEQPQMLSVLSVDMDGLKYINDHFGHRAGDVAICAMADCIRAALPEGAIAARVGGDEFTIVLLTRDADTDAVIRALEEEIRKYNEEEERECPLSASIGAASAEVCDEESYELLTTKSDSEMYRVKRARKKKA